MIQVTNLSKLYTIHGRATDRLRDWVIPWGARRGRPFWALRDISLTVPPGTSLGVVGVNGAGKSTLLKILAGTTVPTEGTVMIEGRVSALLELGMGFHPEFTGRENIAFNGRMLGLSEAELAVKTPAIIEFSEIERFIDQPLRTYSSGMSLRLAFAIAGSVEPDVLIVDEALSVGDIHFQQKCLARIRQFQEAGTTILFVSHDPALVKNFCTEAILLDGGRIIDSGKPDHVLDYYNALLAEKHRGEGGQARIIRPATASSDNGAEEVGAGNASEEAVGETPARFPHGAPTGPLIQTGHRTGNFGAIITQVRLFAVGAGGDNRLFVPGTTATIRVRVAALQRIAEPTIGILIKDRLGGEIYGTNTFIRGLALADLEPGDALDVDFQAPMNLGEGIYSITAAIHSGPTHTEVCYDWIERAETFQILPSPADRFIGVCRLDVSLSHSRSTAAPEELALGESLRPSA